MRLHNLPQSTLRRRQFRKQLTPAEAMLWKHLQRGQLNGTKFRRQHSVGPYILDFFCASARLAIELDGAGHDHDTGHIRDRVREQFLKEGRIRVIRFENRDVLDNPEGVLAQISRAVAST